MSDFDSVWKEALDVYFEPFMAFFFAEAHREIDWARGFEMLDKELEQVTPESEQGRRVVGPTTMMPGASQKCGWSRGFTSVGSARSRFVSCIG